MDCIQAQVHTLLLFLVDIQWSVKAQLPNLAHYSQMQVEYSTRLMLRRMIEL